MPEPPPSAATAAPVTVTTTPPRPKAGPAPPPAASRLLPVAAALLVLCAAGVANGLWNDRWRISNELEQATERLPKVPLTIGSWNGRDDTNPEFVARLKRQGILHELVSRIYTDSRNGEQISVLLATGRPGPISTHNPLTCIGSGTGMRQSERRIDILKVEPPGGEPAAFSHSDFIDDGPVPGGITVFWSWHDPAKGWIAVKDPRTAFAPLRALTKIYVSRSLRPATVGGDRAEDDPAVRFLRECLPTINTTLFGPAQN